MTSSFDEVCEELFIDAGALVLVLAKTEQALDGYSLVRDRSAAHLD